MKLKKFIALLAVVSAALPGKAAQTDTDLLNSASRLISNIYDCYSIPGQNLLAENYPFDESYRAGYLGEGAVQPDSTPRFAYLWPFSGTLSAWAAMYEVSHERKALEAIDNIVMPGLMEYYDTKREPAAYASYVNSAPQSDRFYDDNIWLGIDFTDLYKSTGRVDFLDKAKEVWKFIESGTDSILGGGVYWCEQKKGSKNTCSNAPAAVYALKLYDATKDPKYLQAGKDLYEWTFSNLRDPEDGLYYDNINLRGRVDRTKFAYNSGQMLQAAALLYKLTGNKEYLNHANGLAESCYNFFFTEDPELGFRIINKGNVWFNAVMLRGFCEHSNITGNRKYIDAFRRSIKQALASAVDKDSHLVGTDWTGRTTEERKWLLTQAATVEMLCRLAAYPVPTLFE